MAARLFALCFDANDPLRLAQFWAGVLGRELVEHPDDGIVLLPSDDTGFRLRFVATQEPKVGPNQMHFDLTSTSLEDSSRRWRGRWGSAPGTSTSVNCPRRSTWCSPTLKATSSA